MDEGTKKKPPNQGKRPRPAAGLWLKTGRRRRQIHAKTALARSCRSHGDARYAKTAENALLASLGQEDYRDGGTERKTKKPLGNVQRLLGRYQAESNRCSRFCRPVPNHSAIVPKRECKDSRKFRICKNYFSSAESSAASAPLSSPAIRGSSCTSAGSQRTESSSSADSQRAASCSFKCRASESREHM